MVINIDTLLAAITSEPSSSDTPRPYDCQLLTERIEQAGLTVAHKDFSKEIQIILTDYLNSEKS